MGYGWKEGRKRGLRGREVESVEGGGERKRMEGVHGCRWMRLGGEEERGRDGG